MITQQQRMAWVENRAAFKAKVFAEHLANEPKGRRFGKYPGNDAYGTGIPTAKASYLDGYTTGYTWIDNYTPGGPFVTGLRQHYGAPDPDMQAFHKADRENYDEWHRGFKDGQAKRELNLPEMFVAHVVELGYN